MIEHITIFYSFLSISIGCVYLIIATIIFLKTKNEFLKNILPIHYAFSFYVISSLLEFYLIRNIDEITILTSKIKFMSTFFLYLLLFVLPYCIHSIFKTKHKKIKNIILAILTIAAYLFFIFFKTNEGESFRHLVSSPIGYISKLYYIAILIYTTITILTNHQNIESKTTKNSVKYIGISLSIATPGIINDFYDYLHLPESIFFFPIFYSVLSIILIANLLKKFFKLTKIKNETLPINSDFFKRYNFTSREMDILILILKGFDNKKISETLFISIPTVKKHITSILEKTDTTSRVDLILLTKRYE